MAAVTRGRGLLWLRPLLGVRRAALRRLARGRGRWPGPRIRATPTRASTGCGRARRCRCSPALGIGPERLAATARAMAPGAGGAGARHGGAGGGLPRGRRGRGPGARSGGRSRDAPEELRLRLLAGALGWVSGAVYRPRLVRLEAALAAIEAGRVGHGLTLHGCVLRTRGGRIAIRRELARVAPAVPLAAGRWDGRWQIEGTPPEGEGLTIGALGAGGLARLGGHRPGPAREALAATPGDLARRRARRRARGAARAGLRLSAGLCRAAALGCRNSALNPRRPGLMLEAMTWRAVAPAAAGRSRRRRTWAIPRTSPSGSSCSC